MLSVRKHQKCEGGASRVAEKQLSGIVNQIAWAKQIKTRLNAEFDRVAKVLAFAASKRLEHDRSDIQAVIAILEDKRAEVMAKDQARLLYS